MKGDVYRETSELTCQEDLFCLGNIKSQSDLEEVERGEMEAPSSLGGGDDDEGEIESLSESENEEETEGRILNTVVSRVSIHGHLINIHVTHDLALMDAYPRYRLHRSCYIDPMKYNSWASYLGVGHLAGTLHNPCGRFYAVDCEFFDTAFLDHALINKFLHRI